MKHNVSQSHNCQQHNSDHYDELLTVYAAGNSTPQDRQRVEKLLSQCQDCRHKVMELEQTWWALDVWEQDERQVPLRLNNFRSRLAEVKNQQSSWKRVFEQVSVFFRPAQLMPAMSMAAVIIVAAVMMYHPDNTLINPQENNNTNNVQVTNQQVALDQKPKQIDTPPAQTVLVSYPSVEEKLSREEKFDLALRNNGSQKAQGYRTVRNQYVQTAGFSPSKNIFSSFDMMDENVQLQPVYIPTTRQ